VKFSQVTAGHSGVTGKVGGTAKSATKKFRKLKFEI